MSHPAATLARRTSRRALALGILAALMPGAHAAAAGPDGATTLERVEVVGSRIRRTELETSQPVFVLERDDLVQTGLASVGDILQRITTHGAALNTTFNNGGNGETRIDLRNLGPNRTLVLVNGRRWSTTLDGAVDLNSIPLAIVERIEILKDGASAIYGSDAIAGVVNITTRDDYEGAEASAYLGENAEGDGRVESYDFTLGATGERASAVLNASYVKQEPIFAGDREISAVPVFGLPANDARAGASGTSPFGRFAFGPGGRCSFDASGVYAPGAGTCRPVGGQRPSTTFDPQTGAYRVWDPASDGYNFAPENYLQTPQERSALFAQGRYALADTVSFRTELLYNERRSAQLLAATPISVSAQMPGSLRVVVPANHLYNPFGQAVTQLNIRPGGQSRLFRQDADTFRASAGLDGVFDLSGRSLGWNLGWTYTDTTVAESTRGQVNLLRLRDALGPSFRDASGAPRCGTPDAVIAGCVPFDPFHGPEGLTPTMLDYLYFVSQQGDRRELTNYVANVTGDLFELPAGTLAFALGYEYRREVGAQAKDALLQTGNVSRGGVGEVGFDGRNSVDEAYLELAVPLLADLPLARRLEASLAGRYSDYASFGDTTNLKAGIRWEPGADLLLRGTWSEGFRAPSIFELFDPSVTSAAPTVVFDPCTASFAGDAAARANCAADGVPGGSYVPDVGTFIVSSGGNPQLQPETATSRTLGLVWNPAWLPGFELLVDWFEIELEDSITFVDFERLLAACAFEGAPSACAQTTRDAVTGELLQVDARTLNVGAERVEGYDLTLSYRFDTAFGRFALAWDSVYYAEHVIEAPVGTEALSLIGNYGQFEPGWRIRSNLGLDWRRGDFGAGVAARYFDALDEPCFLGAIGLREACSSPDVSSTTFDGLPENRIDDRWYFDVQASWNAPWNAELRAGVQNVLDEDPPVSRAAFANSFDPQYPVPGRFWYVGYTQRF
ncbi:MAG TPA: TonB-dependent receptor [Xanthomonadales bacterium]|nr:TonB-dependent receptor [Xanthomonadales bacterium]